MEIVLIVPFTPVGTEVAALKVTTVVVGPTVTVLVVPPIVTMPVAALNVTVIAETGKPTLVDVAFELSSVDVRATVVSFSSP